MKIAIYLAGSIKKAHEKGNELCWMEEHMQVLQDTMPGHEISFLNPAFRSDDLSDGKSVFGRDMTQVFCSDFVLVDARDRRGLGVGAEMMWAKFHQIPVVTWAPKETHYHKSSAKVLDVVIENYVHPFIEGLSDVVVETLEEAAAWMEGHCVNPIRPKNVSDIQEAMRHYKDRQLKHDIPMQQLLASNERLKEKI